MFIPFFDILFKVQKPSVKAPMQNVQWSVNNQSFAPNLRINNKQWIISNLSSKKTFSVI